MTTKQLRTISGIACVVLCVVVAVFLTSGPAVLSAKDAAPGKGTSQKSPTNKEDLTSHVPVIHCAESTHNFGTVMIGPPLEHAFTIENKGRTVLKITKVDPKCGCTLAGDYPKEIAPGGKGSFPFKLDSKRLHGKFTKGITIESNDPKTPKLYLKLSGTLNRYIEISPAGAYFGRQFPTEPETKTITLTNTTDKPMKISMAPQPATSQFDFELKEIDPGKKYELEVTSTPPYKPGSYARAIGNLTTNIKEQDNILIHAIMSIAHSTDVFPLMVKGPVNANTTKVIASGRTAEVTVTNYNEKPLKKFKAIPSHDAIDVKIDEVKEGKEYKVSMKFPPGLDIPKSGMKVTLHTDDPARKTINIPIQSYDIPDRALARPNSKPKERPVMQMVGKKAPSVELTTLDGKPINVSDYDKYSATLLNFYAVNCPACKKQIPHLERLRADYEEKGIRVINVTCTLRGKEFPPDQIKEVQDKLNAHIDLAIDPGDATRRRFQVTSYPTLVIVDPQGNIKNALLSGTGPNRARSVLDKMIKENKPST